jgi:Xaa-Pro dipeptidase
MATRRSFLLSAGLAPAALSATPADSAIPQLKNRRAEAQPIATGERRTRIARAQQLMVANKIDAICLAGGTSLNYLNMARLLLCRRRMQQATRYAGRG